MQVRRGTKSLLSLWKAGYEPKEQESDTKLTCPKVLKVSATQTSVTVKVTPLYDEYIYYIDFNGYKETHGEEVMLSDLLPETPQTINLCIAMDDLLNSNPTLFMYL